MSFKPTKSMAEEAERGLKWRDEFNRGGTGVGVARARDISNRRNLSLDTVKRMRSYFSRHEVDKQGKGWEPFTEGYPSAGRIAHALWGGDAGKAWADKILRQEGELTKTVGDEMAEDNGYSAVLEQARANFKSLGLESKIPEGMVIGWPFRFMSTGKIFFYRTLEDDKGESVVHQRGRDITPTDLQDALRIFKDHKYPIRIDREHDMANPRGIVLDLFETIDAEGNPCLACIPAYGPELAQYVKDCGGVLYSSPSIEWADDKGSFIDQRTGENIGKFRVNALAVCVDPGQTPRILDTVRLTSNKDSVIVIASAQKETIPTNEASLYKKTDDVIDDSIMGDTQSPQTKTMLLSEPERKIEGDERSESGDYVMDPEVQKMLEAHMQAIADLRDMVEAFKAEVMDRLAKLEGEEPAEEESTDEASDEEAPAEDMEKDEEKEALRKELEALKTEKLSREAEDTVKSLKLRKADQENAKKAYIAEKLGKGKDLGYRPFSDVFAKMTPAVANGPSGHSEPAGPTDFLGMVETLKKSGMSHGAALSKVIKENPEAYKTYQASINK